MTWKLKYNAPKGLRTNRNFWGVTVFVGDDCWYSKETNLWGKYEALGGSSKSTHDHLPKTKKAFIRYLLE